MGNDTEWVQNLKRLAEVHWTTNRRALLLSQVPQLLEAEGIELSVVLRGRKLKHAIEVDGRGVIWLVQDSRSRLIWGIVHDATAAESDSESLFPERDEDADSIPQFHKAFWTAFIKPLEDDRARYVAVQRPIHFIDIPKGNLPNFEGTEIAAEYLVKSDAVYDDFDVAVYASILNWSNKNGVDLPRFYWTGPSKSEVQYYARNRAKWLVGLSKLSKEDLARISVPLDIVRTLLDGKDAADP